LKYSTKIKDWELQILNHAVVEISDKNKSLGIKNPERPVVLKLKVWNLKILNKKNSKNKQKKNIFCRSKKRSGERNIKYYH